MGCRVALVRLHANGLIELPPSQIRQWRRRASFEPTAVTDPQPPINVAVHELAPLHLCIVHGRGKTSTSHAAQLPVKDSWLYPLRLDFRQVLAS